MLKAKPLHNQINNKSLGARKRKYLTTADVGSPVFGSLDS
jgi:hypothetical protein